MESTSEGGTSADVNDAPGRPDDGEPTHALMGHLYRGQLGRADTWRRRLDATTNWAVVLTATILTWSFSSSDHPHYVLLIGVVGVTLFLFIEARRYRQYDVWRHRTRLLEECLFAEDLEDRRRQGKQWRDELSRDLRQPTAKIPFREALARRLSRVYLWILMLLLLAWALKVWAFAPGSTGLLETMSIERIPGTAVLAVVAGYAACLCVVALWPIPRRAKGKIAEDEQHEPSSS